jgi:hypothetical protein
MGQLDSTCTIPTVYAMVQNPVVAEHVDPFESKGLKPVSHFTGSKG